MLTGNPFITLSENEQIIRTYQCTKLRKFLSSPTIGYLSITNKRIVYHSEGKSINGSSSIISEMPLEDVAGISTSLGISFNWIIFLLVSIVLFLGSSLLEEILPRFLTGWVVSILLVLPYFIGFLFEKNILNKDLREQAIKKLEESSINSAIKQKDSAFYMGVFQILFYIGLAFLSWNLAFRTDLLYQAPTLGYIILLGAYFLIYILFFGRIRSFSLRITSRTAKGTGIYIPGNFLAGIFRGNTAASQSMSAGPDKDAEVVVKELGALITDIQLMGDLGIQKWEQARS